MNEDEWEDVVVGSSDDEWEDVALNEPIATPAIIPARSSPVEPSPTEGLLSGIVSGGLGMAEAVEKGLTTITNPAKAARSIMGIPTQEETPVTNSLSDLFNRAIGVDDATKIGEGTFPHKVGEYLESGMLSGMGPISSTLSGIGAFIGEKEGGPVGEIAGAVAGGNAPGAIKATIKRGANAVNNFVMRQPTQEEAILQAFKLTGENAAEGAPGMRRILKEGVITAPSESRMPFSRTKENFDEYVKELRKETTKQLDKIPTVQTKEIMPKIQDFLEDSKVNLSDASRIVAKEKEEIIKASLARGFPEADPEKLYGQYRAIEAQAKANPKNKEIQDFWKFMKSEVENANWSGNDLWRLNQRLDSNINWNDPAGKSRSNIYLQMRDRIKNKIVERAGGEESAVAGLFDRQAEAFKIEDAIKKMAGTELTGVLRPKPIGQKAIDFIATPVKKALFRAAISSDAEPQTMLKIAFGESFPQKLRSLKVDPVFAPLAPVSANVATDLNIEELLAAAGIG